MAGKYVRIETTELRRFVERLNKAGRGDRDFERELALFLDAVSVEFLSYVQDSIIRAGSVDTRLLLNSFQKNAEGNVFTVQEGGLQIEVGTNVEYASYVNDGHWTNPNGVNVRWVPGEWSGDRFIYQPGAKTGMLLKQKWVEGSHYFDEAVRLMERMAPQFMERKMQQWIDQYFSDFM